MDTEYVYRALSSVNAQARNAILVNRRQVSILFSVCIQMLPVRSTSRT